MTKAVYLIFAALLLSGCYFQNIEITGTAPGMDGSTVSIMDAKHKLIYGANIQSGKFHIARQAINEPGYYFLQVVTNKKEAIPTRRFEVYLEPGKYNITLEKGKSIYPIITSTSDLQNDLTTYHRFTDSVTSIVRHEADKWMNKLTDNKAAPLPDKDFQVVLANTKIWQDKVTNADITTLAAFVAKYPHNKAITHAMANMFIEKDPLKYYAIYQKLGADVKSSDKGKQIGEKLNVFKNLIPGAMAPAFAGETPDGKKADVKALHKKIIIVAFWRSGSKLMEDELHGLANNIMPSVDSAKVGVITVSFDTDRNTWLNSIKNNKTNWVQISDLKGDDSPNAKNWNITMLSNYYLLDGEGRVLYNDLSYPALAFSVNEYLAKH